MNQTGPLSQDWQRCPVPPVGMRLREKDFLIGTRHKPPLLPESNNAI